MTHVGTLDPGNTSAKGPGSALQERRELRQGRGRGRGRARARAARARAARTRTRAAPHCARTAAIASARRRAQASHGRHEHHCNGTVLATASILHVTTRDLYLACANGVNCENNLCPRMRYRAGTHLIYSNMASLMYSPWPWAWPPC